MSLNTLYQQIKEFGYWLSSTDYTELYQLDNHVKAQVVKDINGKITKITFYS